MMPFANKTVSYYEAVRANGELSEEKFVIRTKWWQEWCDYVNLQSVFETQGSSSERISELASPVNDCDRSSMMTENDSTIYNRPNKIYNEPLIDPNTFNSYKYKLIPGKLSSQFPPPKFIPISNPRTFYTLSLPPNRLKLSPSSNLTLYKYLGLQE